MGFTLEDEIYIEKRNWRRALMWNCEPVAVSYIWSIIFITVPGQLHELSNVTTHAMLPTLGFTINDDKCFARHVLGDDSQDLWLFHRDRAAWLCRSYPADLGGTSFGWGNVTTIVYPGHLRSWSMRQYYSSGSGLGSIATKVFSSSLLWVGSWDERTGRNLSGDDDRLSLGVL